MAALRQNQAQEGPPPNVLHDQRIPNTLDGLGRPGTATRFPLRVGAFVAIVLLTAAVLVILVVRLA